VLAPIVTAGHVLEARLGVHRGTIEQNFSSCIVLGQRGGYASHGPSAGQIEAGEMNEMSVARVAYIRGREQVAEFALGKIGEIPSQPQRKFFFRSTWAWNAISDSTFMMRGTHSLGAVGWDPWL